MACGLALAASGPAAPSGLIRFNRDIRPILAENCLQCHGPDKGKRKAKLRLDTRDGLFTAARDRLPVVPGRRDQSELIRRVTAEDPEEVMPPRATGKALSRKQITMLERWIDQGAPWEDHWSYVAPVRPALPGGGPGAWARHPIDRFVFDRLRAEGLRPSPAADRRTLVRRLCLDLTGLPPRPDEGAAFARETDARAYEALVDRLLASPHFGERMAMQWLDVVRYADTDGFHADNYRSVWPYRDYVIRAFNSNLAFDRFTVEQVAGDLLPQATPEQQIASTYNRLSRTTEEGGSQPKEYLAKYAADRVRTTSVAWLGATMGCAECHDHKFDPYTMRDFYSLEAFFADIKEVGVGKPEGTLFPDPRQAAALKSLDERLAPLQSRMDTPTPALEAAQNQWEASLQAGPGVPDKILALVKVPRGERTDEQRKELGQYYRGIAPELAGTRADLEAAKKQREELLKGIPSTLAAVAVEPRPIRVLARGNWMDESGEIVLPGVPRFLGGLAPSGARATRLDLARWLSSRENPLTARVFVNRLWKQFFGAGLAKTLDDLGTRGDTPSHPELLDWLAVEFMDSGWDVKHLVRLIVTSNTYRQTAQADPRLRERDPDNRWLARQSSFRLEAELVRDHALAVSGLLNAQIGGPSVKPYQPAGYWDFLNFPKRTWEADHGNSLYRRGLYVFWCRSFLHPSLTAFDAPSREECTAARTLSNTPLQALVLLNDPSYVEAARVLAERITDRSGAGVRDRIRWAFHQVLDRAPGGAEARTLEALYRQQKVRYTSDREAAVKLAHAGPWPAQENADAIELAAWTAVARVLLNLHETITRY